MAVSGSRSVAAIGIALGLLAASGARAQGVTLEDSSRITLLAGWQRGGSDLAFRSEPVSNGGPLGSLTFGYSPVGWGELGIDLFAGGQRLWKAGDAPWGTLYGALVGGRAQLALPAGLIVRVGAHVGPAIVTGPDLGEGFTETLGTALAGSAGLEAHLSPEWSLNLEYRYVLAQGVVAIADGAHVFNAGGHSLLVGATFSFLPGSRGTWGP